MRVLLARFDFAEKLTVMFWEEVVEREENQDEKLVKNG